MENTIKLYNGRAYGVRVSSYGIEKGYLDYCALAGILRDCILNNTIRTATYSEDWELVSGEDHYGVDENGKECSMYDDECVDMIPKDVYQDYIISEEGARILSRWTTEIVYYNAELDIHIWGVTHYGTSWDYVLTDIKVEEAL